MAVFAIFLDDANVDSAGKRIQEHYPGTGHLALDVQLFLVNSDSTLDTVAETVGLKGDNQIPGLTGLILKLNGAYSGFTYQSNWGLAT